MKPPTSLPTRLYLTPVPPPTVDNDTRVRRGVETAVWIVNVALTAACGVFAAVSGIRDVLAGWPLSWTLLWRVDDLVLANLPAAAVAGAGFACLEWTARQLWSIAFPGPVFVAERVADDDSVVGEVPR
jgi:hypothetical protein